MNDNLIAITSVYWVRNMQFGFLLQARSGCPDDNWFRKKYLTATTSVRQELSGSCLRHEQLHGGGRRAVLSLHGVDATFVSYNLPSHLLI